MSKRTEIELESYSRLGDRFWARVDRSGGPDACWPWKLACSPAGYGTFQFKVKNVGYTFIASRWASGFDRGLPLRWDEGLKEEACHKCDNPPCCNPAHLYVGDRASNIGDAWNRGHFADRTSRNAAKTHCPNGHEYAGPNLYVDSKRNKRECRACGADRARRYRAEQREADNAAARSAL